MKKEDEAYEGEVDLYQDFPWHEVMQYLNLVDEVDRAGYHAAATFMMDEDIIDMEHFWPSGDLRTAFPWEDTVQGFKFWYSISVVVPNPNPHSI